MTTVSEIRQDIMNRSKAEYAQLRRLLNENKQVLLFCPRDRSSSERVNAKTSWRLGHKIGKRLEA